jgi:hypothetical protein
LQQAPCAESIQHKHNDHMIKFACVQSQHTACSTPWQCLWVFRFYS